MPIETLSEIPIHKPIDYSSKIEVMTTREEVNGFIEWENIALNQYRVIRRNGQLTGFNANKIAAAMTKAFLAVEGGAAKESNRIHQTVRHLTDGVVKGISRRLQETGMVHIEEIQDQVELVLMRAGEHKVARAYVVYRDEHAQLRAEKKEKPVIHVLNSLGESFPLDETRLRVLVAEACHGLAEVKPEFIVEESLKNLFDGILEKEVNQALVMSTRVLIEREPNYTYVAARLLLDYLRNEALTFVKFTHSHATAQEMSNYYAQYFAAFVQQGVAYELLDPRLATDFDLSVLGQALVANRDFQFTYLGLQTLYDRYFLHWEGTRFELPQAFFMRVSMGLALNEPEKEARAIEFYHLLSSFDFMCSTPTLFNSGTLRPQLSSCYLTTVPDDLEGIYNAIKDNAMLSKFAGGLGNDWTYVRGMGSHIKGTNGTSQGVVPFLKVANDTLVAVNQCFAPETSVWTADGVKPIQEIVPGDLVLGQRGEYREVLKILPYHTLAPMIEIDIKHSVTPLRVTTGHPFLAIKANKYDVPQRVLARLSQEKVKPQWVEAGQLQKWDYVAQVIPREIVPVENFTEEDARLYGIMLGDGYCSKREQDWGTHFEWGVSGNPNKDTHLSFVRNYLDQHGIHYWESDKDRGNYIQLRWSFTRKVLRDHNTGRFMAGEPVLSFDHNDLYNEKKQKRIARRFSHLPLPQTLALVQGLLETDGGISRGKEIYFTNTSHPLIEGLRYQCLRLGVPVAGQYRERQSGHEGTRSDGVKIFFKDGSQCYDLRIPAIPSLAELLQCQPLTKKNWFQWQGYLFTRVKARREIESVPFIYDLKVEGDPTYTTTSALVHNGGRRRGSGCAYLETWHIDIEEFLELRKNTGDERRRTHDMNTANWVPDLFMERVYENKPWTLFSPNEVPDLHDCYGHAFKETYQQYEQAAIAGKLKVWKQVLAVELWRKMLTMLFETGHPWITFKDPCNLRNPQAHLGVVHSSNLCTEITLNTSFDEIAVCNLASVNLAAHIKDGQLDTEKLQQTIRTGMRMLDNVIDINYYSVSKAKVSNLRHRPVGLGLMGFQDALYQLRLSYCSPVALEFADNSMEVISYYAILASTELAQERGRYSSFDGSLWSQGILPIDSIQQLAKARGTYLEMSTSATLDWESLRARVQQVGMRHSNCMAIAPTATISNICGVTQSIEPTYQNLFVKSNLSGEFTVINPYLVQDLKALGLWDEVMVNDLKHFDGSIRYLDRIPEELKILYATAFEIDPSWLVEAASRRQKWIDQSQSLNLYMIEPSGRKLDGLYKLAWIRGLKTTYYLRAMAATHVEKSTVRHKPSTLLPSTVPACVIDEPECEACQ